MSLIKLFDGIPLSCQRRCLHLKRNAQAKSNTFLEKLYSSAQSLKACSFCLADDLPKHERESGILFWLDLMNALMEYCAAPSLHISRLIGSSTRCVCCCRATFDGAISHRLIYTGCFFSPRTREHFVVLHAGAPFCELGASFNSSYTRPF